MNGHVFQTFNESQDKRQYTKTLEALQRYVNKNCKYASDLDELFKLEEPTITRPEDISAEDVKDQIKLLKWTEDAKAYIRREQALQDNTRDIYSIIWGQCSLSLQAKIKQEKDFIENDNKKKCVWLLKQIKNAIYKFDSKRDLFFYSGSTNYTGIYKTTRRDRRGIL
jgi:hypothetical protein